ncbi:MAG: electron transport complex, RnfABCDGE type, subunit [Sphingobacteriales bacterium]|nr:electron transport complex, RnfABCDGE type, subunit [Sphingobacteriales bacterium]
MFTAKKFFTSSILILISLSSFAQLKVSPSNASLHYMGRIITEKDSATILSWPGSSVTIKFKGTGLKATLKDEKNQNYYNIIIDGKIVPLKPDTQKKEYVLASNLNYGLHTVQLFKKTEWEWGKTWLYGFEVIEGNKLKKVKAPKRRIEFYGNSITCGFGALDYSGKDSGAPEFEDNYIAYDAITARHFNADYNCIAKSGIGILVSWFPLIMSEMYDRLDATSATLKWDFNNYKPQIVVINLFQNDSWIIKKTDHPEFKHRFGEAKPSSDTIIKHYQDLVKSIRSKYPKAHIICALGNMDATQKGSPWPGYIESAVNNLKDNKIYTHFFPYKNTPGHPKVEEQKVMADDLIAFIEGKHLWD